MACHCLAPAIGDGDTLIVDPGGQMHPEDEVEFTFTVEQLNPPKHLRARCFLAAAIHRVVHVLPKGCSEVEAAAAAAAGRA